MFITALNCSKFMAYEQKMAIKRKYGRLSRISELFGVRGRAGEAHQSGI